MTSFNAMIKSKKKYKPPSKLRRDALRLAAHRKKNTRLETPSESSSGICRSCSSGTPSTLGLASNMTLLESVIHEHFIGPMQLILFCINTFFVGCIILFYDIH